MHRALKPTFGNHWIAKLVNRLTSQLFKPKSPIAAAAPATADFQFALPDKYLGTDALPLSPTITDAGIRNVSVIGSATYQCVEKTVPKVAQQMKKPSASMSQTLRITFSAGIVRLSDC